MGYDEGLWEDEPVKIPHGSMTISELQRIVVRLSNSCWVRWWAIFNDVEHRSGGSSAMMAIQALDWVESDQPGYFDGFRDPEPHYTLRPTKINGIEEYGFVSSSDPVQAASHIYTILRVNDDGTPFVSKL